MAEVAECLLTEAGKSDIIGMMIRLILLSLLASLNLTPLAERPNLVGLATWYDPCSFYINRGDKEACEAETHRMANGEKFQADASTVAVDKSERERWLNHDAILLTECGKLVRVKITDTGLLYAAGEFRHGIKKICSPTECTGVLRFWPTTTTDVLWSSELSYRVVTDFPRDTFKRRVTCEPDAPGELETTIIAVWVTK